VTQNTNKKY